MNEEQFRRELRARGYAEPQTRDYDPDVDNEMHTHEFSAMVLVKSGEFTLALEDRVTTYGPGEWCELEAGTVHAERTGPGGASVLLARK